MGIHLSDQQTADGANSDTNETNRMLERLGAHWLLIIRAYLDMETALVSRSAPIVFFVFNADFFLWLSSNFAAGGSFVEDKRRLMVVQCFTGTPF